MTSDEAALGTGRFSTDRAGYTAMVKYAKQWPDRVWAVEGCQSIGRHIATRLLAEGEQVVDVPPKLSRGRGCSPPVRAARLTPPTHTPSWSQPGRMRGPALARRRAACGPRVGEGDAAGSSWIWRRRQSHGYAFRCNGGLACIQARWFQFDQDRRRVSW
ncbi:IS110 family transposase [Micromonospora sp. KC213]|uniref:IS110 family transposase n=1 Tax=Micromonospora sp. KC213 TaxID=2530378 RepID=UPI001FB57ACC|nr:IS110 family transposase [Micromonospora sp. KC213]